MTVIELEVKPGEGERLLKMPAELSPPDERRDNPLKEARIL